MTCLEESFSLSFFFTFSFIHSFRGFSLSSSLLLVVIWWKRILKKKSCLVSRLIINPDTVCKLKFWDNKSKSFSNPSQGSCWQPTSVIQKPTNVNHEQYPRNLYHGVDKRIKKSSSVDEKIGCGWFFLAACFFPLHSLITRHSRAYGSLLWAESFRRFNNDIFGIFYFSFVAYKECLLRWFHSPCYEGKEGRNEYHRVIGSFVYCFFYIFFRTILMM